MDHDFFSGSASTASSSNLTRAQKAAAILVAMGKPVAGRLLKFFKHEELKALIEGARMLKTIPQSELEQIIAEFEDEFAEGAGLMDSAATMDTILSESLTPEEVSAIMNHGTDNGAAQAPQPVWPLVEKLEPEIVGAYLAGEHPQTAAVVLTHLSNATAANVLLTLPKAMRGDVAKRMVMIATVRPTALRMVENQLRAALLGESASKSPVEGQARVATLLNELDKAQLEEILAEMESAGSSDVQAIRSQIFSFDDLALMSQKARLVLFDGLSTELVTLALRGAPKEIAEAVLSALGARSRRMIESELSMEGNAPAAEIARARREIASTAIRLSKGGAIELPTIQAAA